MVVSQKIEELGTKNYRDDTSQNREDQGPKKHSN